MPSFMNSIMQIPHVSISPSPANLKIPSAQVPGGLGSDRHRGPRSPGWHPHGRHRGGDPWRGTLRAGGSLQPGQPGDEGNHGRQGVGEDVFWLRF